MSYPDIEIDMMIIANHRLKSFKESSQIPFFICPQRGYCIEDNEIIIIFNPIKVVDTMHIFPLAEIYILENNKVILFDGYKSYS